jgi:tight adherence protein C
MSLSSPLLAGFLATLCVAIGLSGIPLLLDRGPIERFQGTGGVESGGRRSIVIRLVEWLTAKLGPRIAPTIRLSRREAIGRRLDLAGRPGGMTVQRYVGLKSALLLLGFLLSMLVIVAGGTPLIAVLLCGLGWFGPDIYVSREGRLRQEQIERDLPDFLDILEVTVRAGLGYRLALGRVADALGGPVGEEMLVALRQMSLGASRRSAFEALRDRNASEQLSSFVAAQLQAEELGVPLSEALNDIAHDMRRAAHQAARRRAARATPRVSLIITSLIVPGTMILIIVSIVLGSGLTKNGGPF